MIANRIKFECFSAFIHSRLTSVGTDDSAIVLSNIEMTKAVSITNELALYFGKIATIEQVNNQIKNNKSVLISNQYYDNYTQLLNILDTHLKEGDEMIGDLIAVSMIMSFIDIEKHSKKIKIDSEKLNEVFDIFEKSITNKKLILKMMRIGTEVTESFWNINKKAIK